MKKFGKNYVEASKKVDKKNLYSYTEAIKLAKSLSKTKFEFP